MTQPEPRILFVDDDPQAGRLFARFTEGRPLNCTVFQEAKAALAHFERSGADLIVSDLRMPGMDGIEFLKAVRAHSLSTPFLLITAHSTVNNAIEAIRLGATDFIKKPYDVEELLVQIERALEGRRLRAENRQLKRELRDSKLRFGMIGDSKPMRDVFATIEKISDLRCSVIIEGESGTGKELAARAIHNAGKYAQTPFVVIDCGTLSDTLLESELFGHERGAFTGADHRRQGLLETASGGTVFLDEIGNISPAMQSKLLRVIQEQEVVRVGGRTPIAIDVRFVAATHRNLEQMVADGEFRHDLYHRLNVVKLTMPRLAEHAEDIPLLTQHFIEQINRQFKREVEGFDSASIASMMRYGWPGNVRELRNLIERHVALAEGNRLHLDTPLAEATSAQALTKDQPTLAELEQRYILQVLAENQNSRERTAQVLGINKSTLWRKLRQYGEAPPAEED